MAYFFFFLESLDLCETSKLTAKTHGGILGQSVLAGTRSESRRAGEWVRKASDDVIGNRYGYLHVIYQSLSNLYLISI